MEFESNVGDLASLLKVEKKRAAAMRADARMVMIVRIVNIYMYFTGTQSSRVRLYEVHVHVCTYVLTQPVW